MNSVNDNILDVSKLSFTGTFEQQVEEILCRVRLTRSEVERLNILLDDLEHIFSHNWPGSHVHPFGSIVTGLGIKTSDVDCYVELPSNFPYSNAVKRARSLLHHHSREYTKLICINTAKVPILKFEHIPTGCQCDISFSSPNGVRNSKLIAYLLNMDPRALRLAILVKYWSKVYNLAGTNLMPNYSLTMMVIFYLQVKSILPSVAKLQIYAAPHFVDSWNTAFDPDSASHHCDNSESLYMLLGGFFNYYRNFNYELDVISPFLGHTVKKETLKDVNALTTYDLYKHNLTYKLCEPIKLDTVICVQDPFNHSRNCAVAVYPKLFKRILDHIELSAKKFREHSKEGYLKELFNLAIPLVAPTSKHKKQRNANNIRNNQVFAHKPQFKQPNGRQLVKNRTTRAKELFLRYKTETR